VAVDRQGDIYVADFFNNTIRKIDVRTRVISTVAGQIPTSPAQGHCC
jgi:DNA-binding beta-propeller fold protein YncE